MAQEYIPKDPLQTLALTPATLGDSLQAGTPEQRAHLYLATDVVKDWVEQQRERIMASALNGEEVAGFELRFRSGRTSVTNLGAVKNSLKKFKISLDDLAGKGTVSLTDLEGIVCQDLVAKERTARKRDMMSLLAAGSALKTGEDQPYLHRTN